MGASHATDRFGGTLAGNLDAQRAFAEIAESSAPLRSNVAIGSFMANLDAVTLRAVARVEAQQHEALTRVAEAEARVGEWTAELDVNAALDYYNAIVDLIEGRVAKAKGAAELNVVLRDLLLHVHVDTRPVSEALMSLGWMPGPDYPDDAPAGVIRATFVVRGDGVGARPDGAPEGGDYGVVAWADPDRLGTSRRVHRPSCTTNPSSPGSPRRRARQHAAKAHGAPAA